MRRSLFLAILERVCTRDSYFIQKSNAIDIVGLSSYKKLTTALCMLIIGVCADAINEYCRISKIIIMKYIKKFCITIHVEFGEHHIKKSIQTDFEKRW
jgi:hypothetical protein